MKEYSEAKIKSVLTMVWMRFNVICGWVILLLIDCIIGIAEPDDFKSLRQNSNDFCRRIWNKYKIRKE